METTIYNSDQKSFLEKNLDDQDRIKNLKRQLADSVDRGEIVLGSNMASSTMRELMNVLNEDEVRIRDNLAPFIKKEEEFERRKEEIRKAHGLGKDDFSDDATLKDIVNLTATMRQENMSLPENLREDNSKGSELDSMFKTDRKEETSNLARQFK